MQTNNKPTAILCASADAEGVAFAMEVQPQGRVVLFRQAFTDWLSVTVLHIREWLCPE